MRCLNGKRPRCWTHLWPYRDYIPILCTKSQGFSLRGSQHNPLKLLRLEKTGPRARPTQPIFPSQAFARAHKLPKVLQYKAAYCLRLFMRCRAGSSVAAKFGGIFGGHIPRPSGMDVRLIDMACEGADPKEKPYKLTGVSGACCWRSGPMIPVTGA